MQIKGRRVLRRIAVLVLIATLGGRPGMTSAADPLVIPVIVSQTGTAAFLGKAETEGVQTLERVVNQAGGIKGQAIHFDIHDDASNPAQTVQLFNEINATHPAVIIGPSLAATC